MDYWLLPILLLLLLAGYLIGRRVQRKKSRLRRQDRHVLFDSKAQQYISGLNFLLNEEGDAAAEAFIDALPVSRQTLQTHLSLGRMLRKNGEISSAIRTHQSLLASPYLEADDVDLVQLELAINYVVAGLLDRAEALLKDSLKAQDPYIRQQALEHLVALYREEKEWQKAIEVINRHAERRFGRATEEWVNQQSHFSCELAELSIKRGAYQEAQRQLRAALAFDKRSLRAQLLQVKLQLLSGDHAAARKKIKKLILAGCDIWEPMAELLLQIYEQSGRSEQVLQELREISVSHGVEPLLETVYGELQKQSPEQAREYLQEMFEASGSDGALANILGDNDQKITPLRPLLRNYVLQQQAIHMPHICSGCGYSSQQHYWLCPTCKSWGMGRRNLRAKPGKAQEKSS
ncbi:hypothetical protein [Pseudoteredinibacter isoporae]|uniref:Lipopolysaccharide biosynthesis regulator YciM n=1 Tax=Pseudoteredinibacter isoporae TaxID=570281 RepID=A0A7X0MXH5_9GAMM|nr:hypothetical protein [Pseudoteredinibacter isoporae]MBB6522004.1 lipopolysaccharide biosynthesis regulator YciM [Pseudoteredinibacter isoporae]NHO87540.1 hypothetical protein [Pseudoteredinibacter isoporae]NIB24129.1 hypothetical protein [Pseudoteredinibacter isoporae]